MKRKKAILVGIDRPIKLKSKSYVIKSLYKRAKKNPFICEKTFEEFMEHIKDQVKDLEGIEIQAESEVELYNALKNIGWIKE
jgi:hypothetical protein